MKKIICFFKGHRRGKTTVKFLKCSNDFKWQIRCEKCVHVVAYISPRTRLIGTEMRLGFDGK